MMEYKCEINWSFHIENPELILHLTHSLSSAPRTPPLPSPPPRSALFHHHLLQRLKEAGGGGAAPPNSCHVGAAVSWGDPSATSELLPLSLDLGGDRVCGGWFGLGWGLGRGWWLVKRRNLSHDDFFIFLEIMMKKMKRMEEEDEVDGRRWWTYEFLIFFFQKTLRSLTCGIGNAIFVRGRLEMQKAYSCGTKTAIKPIFFF